MKDLGLPITNRETTTASNPQPPPSPAPSVAASTTSSSTLLRPSSAIDALNTHSGIGGSASSPLKSEFKIPPRPDSTMSTMSEGRSHEMLHITRPFSTSFTNPSVIPNQALSRVGAYQESTPAAQIPMFYSLQIAREVSEPLAVSVCRPFSNDFEIVASSFSPVLASIKPFRESYTTKNFSLHRPIAKSSRTSH